MDEVIYSRAGNIAVATRGPMFRAQQQTNQEETKYA